MIPPNDSVRQECIRGFEWPDSLRNNLDKQRRELLYDRDLLLGLALEKCDSSHFVLTFLSHEYLQLGVSWAKSAMRAGIRFAIAAVDSETVSVMSQLDIPHVPVRLPPKMMGMRQNKNP
jgi:hypothetical protein